MCISKGNSPRTWGFHGKIIYKSSINVHLKGNKKHLLLGEFSIVLFDWTHPKACENSDWIPGDPETNVAMALILPWRMGVATCLCESWPSGGNLNVLDLRVHMEPLWSHLPVRTIQEFDDIVMSHSPSCGKIVWHGFLHCIHSVLGMVITMASTSTSWDVTPTAMVM